jgi:hypothetical protein
MADKYRLETWKKKQWKGTIREQTTTIKRLVKRDSKGHFVKGTPVITEVREKVYGSGVYYVGIYKNKIITRKLKVKRNVQWYEARKEAVTNHKLYRSSYVLNNVPISKNGYFGFRIVCFSNSEKLLKDLRSKMKSRLIRWIEECVKYSSDEFWFDMYFGYESPTVTNAFRSENNKYYLTMENNKGMIIKEKDGRLNEL